jgi:hypothetical protein
VELEPEVTYATNLLMSKLLNNLVQIPTKITEMSTKEAEDKGSTSGHITWSWSRARRRVLPVAMEMGTAPGRVLLLACATSGSLLLPSWIEREGGETGEIEG